MVTLESCSSNTAISELICTKLALAWWVVFKEILHQYQESPTHTVCCYRSMTNGWPGGRTWVERKAFFWEAFTELRKVVIGVVMSVGRSVCLSVLFFTKFEIWIYSDTSANEDNSFRDHIRQPKRDFPVGLYRKSFNSFWILPTI